jgi:hypothetical protein
MERKVVIVCSVVGFLGILSAALGFAAEGTRVKVRPVPLPLISLSRRGRCAAVSSVRRRLISLACARSRLLFRRLKSEKSSSWSAVPLVKERYFSS